jgi:hypothetical protein
MVFFSLLVGFCLSYLCRFIGLFACIVVLFGVNFHFSYFLSQSHVLAQQQQKQVAEAGIDMLLSLLEHFPENELVQDIVAKLLLKVAESGMDAKSKPGLLLLCYVLSFFVVECFVLEGETYGANGFFSYSSFQS